MEDVAPSERYLQSFVDQSEVLGVGQSRFALSYSRFSAPRLRCLGSHGGLRAMLSEKTKIQNRTSISEEGVIHRALARHLLRYSFCPIFLKVQYALALLPLLDTSVAIAPRPSSKTVDFFEPINKKQPIFSTAPQHGKYLLVTVMSQRLEHHRKPIADMVSICAVYTNRNRCLR